MKNEVIIRPAVIEDSESIERVARRTWSSTYAGIIPVEVQERLLASYYSLTGLRGTIDRADTWFFVAAAQDEVIGYAQFFKRDGEDGSAELSRIYVLPEWQREGIGGLLLAEGLSHLAERAASQLFVNVEKNNLVGRRFYEKHGFHPGREFDVDLAGYPVTLVQYRLDIAWHAG